MAADGGDIVRCTEKIVLWWGFTVAARFVLWQLSAGVVWWFGTWNWSGEESEESEESEENNEEDDFSDWDDDLYS